jgi:hypothetical protein
MNQRFAVTSFLVLLALSAVFVWSTSGSLPSVVASHFDASGTANAFMPSGTYARGMLVVLIGVPGLTAFLPFALARMGGRGLNIPNREYWLAPERIEESLVFLQQHCLVFASGLVVFLSYVHWLVVQANLRQPPLLSTSAIVAGLGVFLCATIVWLVVLYARFRKVA